MIIKSDVVIFIIQGATNGTTVTRWITDKLNKLDGHIQVGSDPRYMNAGKMFYISIHDLIKLIGILYRVIS